MPADRAVRRRTAWTPPARLRRPESSAPAASWLIGFATRSRPGAFPGPGGTSATCGPPAADHGRVRPPGARSSSESLRRSPAPPLSRRGSTCQGSSPSSRDRPRRPAHARVPAPCAAPPGLSTVGRFAAAPIRGAIALPAAASRVVTRSSRDFSRPAATRALRPELPHCRSHVRARRPTAAARPCAGFEALLRGSIRSSGQVCTVGRFPLRAPPPPGTLLARRGCGSTHPPLMALPGARVTDAARVPAVSSVSTARESARL